jgi:hypothetical protein
MTMTYPRPKSRVAEFFWRRKIWFEATFVFSMLEPWEKILLRPYFSCVDCLLLTTATRSETVAIFSLVFALFLVGLFKYLPEHVFIMQRRLMYYLWGQEGDERFLWQRFGARQGVGLLKEL